MPPSFDKSVVVPPDQRLVKGQGDPRVPAVEVVRSPLRTIFLTGVITAAPGVPVWTFDIDDRCRSLLIRHMGSSVLGPSNMRATWDQPGGETFAVLDPGEELPMFGVYLRQQRIFLSEQFAGTGDIIFKVWAW